MVDSLRCVGMRPVMESSGLCVLQMGSNVHRPWGMVGVGG